MSTAPSSTINGIKSPSMPRGFWVAQHPNKDGIHVVHQDDCKQLSLPSDRIFLGHFAHCWYAVAKAREHFPHVYGCEMCATDCFEH